MSVKVSVIIPVYNAGRYLSQCLESVTCQTLREIEIICVDDGSTDFSGEIISSYMERDSRIRLVYEDNAGAGAARNAGLGIASGEYVQFLDSDDWFEETMLEEMYLKAQRYSADIVVCRTVQFDSRSGREIPSDWMEKYSGLPEGAFSPISVADRLFQFTYGQVWDKMFRRMFLMNNSLSFPSLRASEDVPFTYRAMLTASSICVVPKVFVHYRVNILGSVSKSFMKYPDAPFDAFSMVYDFLTSGALVKVYEKSFSLWALEYLPWQICSASERSLRKHYYMLFHTQWIGKLTIDRSVISALCLPSRLRYLCVRYLPFGVLDGVLLLYRMIRKRK